MNKDKMTKDYILFIRMRKTLCKQINNLDNEYHLRLKKGEKTMILKKIAIKRLRLKKIDDRIKKLRTELNLSVADAVSYKTYGMSSNEVTISKGKNKKEWSDMLKILSIVFENSCY